MYQCKFPILWTESCPDDPTTFGCPLQVNSTWLITSELANQRAWKALFTCVVYTKTGYLEWNIPQYLADEFIYNTFKWQKKHSTFSPGKLPERRVFHWVALNFSKTSYSTSEANFNIFFWGVATKKQNGYIRSFKRSSYNRVFRKVVMAAVDLRNEYIIWPTGEYHKSHSKIYLLFLVHKC